MEAVLLTALSECYSALFFFLLFGFLPSTHTYILLSLRRGSYTVQEENALVYVCLAPYQ